MTRTVTITPTKTNTRTPTTESSQSRDGLHHKAGYISSFPNLDGHCDEYWTDSYPVSSVVYGGENWNGNDDLSGSVSLGWDEDNLYVCAKINDDDYVQNANGYDIYLGDSLEINLDKNLQDDFDDNNRSSDDYQLGISPGYGDLDGPKEAFVWFPREKAGSRSQVDVGTEDRSGGYRIEAAIPWSIYGISPNTGDRFGFAFSISDNDDRDENVQQSMTSSVAGRKLLNPTTWGELKLVD